MFYGGIARSDGAAWPSKVGVDGPSQIDKRAAAALDTGRQRRPDAFAPAASRLAPRALRDLAVDDYRAELLLDAVVGRFHARPLQER